MELLAPAGGVDQLKAAISFGADAVYLAGHDFGMRARAANFDIEGIAEAVELAHCAGVSVYVACNVMMMQEDIETLPEFLENVDDARADALIIGDLGALSLARRYAPHCRIHVSTQASVANSEAAKMWHSLGAKRIVCAREMTLAEIASMRRAIPDDLELETFVHGAQCMAVSGRCLISSYLAERSGNRGDCTQPCRWHYSLVEEKRPGEYISVEESERGSLVMNAMDLNMIDHLAELQDAGVDSVKIEGRNKKAFYVATVVNAYRQALDLLYSGESVEKTDSCMEALRSELLDVSHRPYSEGFFYGEPKQAIDYDGYEQQTLHVADVTDCRTLPEGMHLLSLRCRNRFSEGDRLEVLSPSSTFREIEIRDLRHAGTIPADGCGCASDASDACAIDAIGKVEVANRTSDIYTAVCPFPLEPGSFLRARTFRRTSR